MTPDQSFPHTFTLRGELLEVCHRFADAAQDGTVPEIEEYLAEWQEPARSELLRELIKLECHFRQRANRPVTGREFLDRFPDDGEIVQDCFSQECDTLDTNRASEVDATAEFIRGQNHNEELPGHIGRFSVKKLLGQGAFGSVYLVYDDQLKQLRAIKVPHTKFVSDASYIELYRKEAQVVAALDDHPNIVRVCEVGRTDEHPFFVVSKYIDGEDLKATLQRQPLQASDAVRLVASLADALHFAHTHGVTHRDVKPANILLDKNGKPYLADFGMALRDEEVGEGESYVGTPAYMSPEQVRQQGHLVDGRSDIFSLGVVLYELLAGRRPFRGETIEELQRQIESLDPKPLRQIDDNVPVPLQKICARALAKPPQDRYQAADEMAHDLRHLHNFDPAKVSASRFWPALIAGVVLICAIVAWSMFGPAVNQDDENIGRDDSTEVPVTAIETPVAPLQVLSLDIQHFANLNDEFDQPRGVIGKESFGASLNDSVTVRAELSEPAYAYLIAFRPDGVDELCYPVEETEAPPLTRYPAYPPPDQRGVNYGLSEGTGLWIFAVVASKQPLPPYKQWRAQRSLLPWKRSPAPTNVVLRDDGQWLERLAPGGSIRGSRGKGNVANDGTALIEVTDWLKRETSEGVVSAVGLGVVSTE